MAIRDIVTHPAPVLRKKARKITDFGPDLQALIEDMVETMREAPGVGLAAPQVGIGLQLIVVEYGEKDEEQGTEEPPKLFAIANPEIIRVSNEQEMGTEGCLSIPGFVGDVERADVITLKGVDRRGKPVRIKAKGWLARIFQHEIDHLNGVLFIDRAEKVWKVEEQTGQVSPAD